MTVDHREICRVAVCGIGQMGAAAAVCFERAGFDVSLWARNAERLAKVDDELSRLRGWLDDRVGPASAAGSLRRCTDLSELDDAADLVMDCIFEDMDQKAALLARFSQAIKREALFITTTSGLSITEMARRSGVGPLLVGAHFWNPPHLMPVVEVIRGEETANEAFECVCRLVEAIGKIPIRVQRDVPGFIGNRLQHAMWREAVHLVEQGVASAEDIDRVAQLTFALRLPAVGPLANADLVGLDLLAAIQGYLLGDLSTAAGVMPGVRQRLDENHRGMATGRGFHDWSQRDAKALIELRDQQIVRQLEFLKQHGILR